MKGVTSTRKGEGVITKAFLQEQLAAVTSKLQAQLQEGSLPQEKQSLNHPPLNSDGMVWPNGNRILSELQNKQ